MENVKSISTQFLNENRIQIRHGETKPTQDSLLEYELGYSTIDKKIYIGRAGQPPLCLNPTPKKVDVDVTLKKKGEAADAEAVGLRLDQKLGNSGPQTLGGNGPILTIQAQADTKSTQITPSELVTSTVKSQSSQTGALILRAPSLGPDGQFKKAYGPKLPDLSKEEIAEGQVFFLLTDENGSSPGNPDSGGSGIQTLENVVIDCGLW